MKLQIDENKIYRASQAAVIHDLGNENFAIWNRYLPSVVYLNADGIKFFKFLETNSFPYKKFRGFKRTFRKLIQANLVYSHQNDPYKNEFLEGTSQCMHNIHESMELQKKERLPYISFSIFNQNCNMKCPYCIVSYIKSNRGKLVKRTPQDKLANLKKIIDKVFHCYQTEKDQPIRMMLNGGEILLEWDVIKEAILYMKATYPKADIELNINTNATLMTHEIAQFLVDQNFSTIGVSFDGYKETHNQTRTYHNGKETFDHVLKGVEILNQHLPKPLPMFQGTLTGDHELDIEKLMEMKNHNFDHARLGVNLLGISTQEAKKMADLHFQIALRSTQTGWSVMDDFFKSYHSILSAETHRKRFTFFCRGFTDLAGKSFYYNIDTEQVNILCHYVTDTQLTLDEIDGDIYHPLIFEKGYNYLQKRLEVFKENCTDCIIAGICRGGCILSGIDPFNKMNPAACLFLKETWKQYLSYAFDENKERLLK